MCLWKCKYEKWQYVGNVAWGTTSWTGGREQVSAAHESRTVSVHKLNEIVADYWQRELTTKYEKGRRLSLLFGDLWSFFFCVCSYTGRKGGGSRTSVNLPTAEWLVLPYIALEGSTASETRRLLSQSADLSVKWTVAINVLCITDK